jgi:benzoyl-CoA reductase/2-hydroxyglutaryl-CoA dehydratase subunit BcrC/BadD/HgdB
MSEMLDNPAYMNLVEENCLVAMDDMDTGIRYVVENVDTGMKDPAAALAKRYLGRHAAPRLSSWDAQIDQIITWAKEYNIDGILSLPHSWCYPQKYRVPFIAERLNNANIPNISLDRDYHFANAGQLRTRIGAFLEMIGSKQESKA